MLRINLSDSQKYCDGLSRRSFLALGTLGLGGLTLADLYRAEAAGSGTSHKAVINIHLNGGPSHQDMWDLKPDAPSEYRGEFNPIHTNVPGMDICEHFPKLSKMATRSPTGAPVSAAITSSPTSGVCHDWAASCQT